MQQPAARQDYEKEIKAPRAWDQNEHLKEALEQIKQQSAAAASKAAKIPAQKQSVTTTSPAPKTSDGYTWVTPQPLSGGGFWTGPQADGGVYTVGGGIGGAYGRNW